uniref:Uncharacterized protein n=1 Tax=Lepeophtheirus salmonis TaxID=72036 RepID=A0A0K2UY77_LEPSM
MANSMVLIIRKDYNESTGSLFPPAFFRGRDILEGDLFIFLAMSAIEECAFFLKVDFRQLTDTEGFLPAPTKCLRSSSTFN